MAGWKRAIAVSTLLAFAIGSSGCLSGAIYTHTTLPLDVNFDGTLQKPDYPASSWKTLVIPAYVVSLEFDWGSIAVADAIENAGIETVHYADLETFSVLGVWTEQTIHVYGE